MTMADKDTVTKEYMQDSATFADAFNFLLYDGRQVIRPESLRPLDTTAIVLPYGDRDDSLSVPMQRYRDVLKLVTVMEDDKAAYLLLGIENQSQIHYAMPVRNMLYDAIQYAAQIENTAKAHRKSGHKPATGAEFLSGFYGTDKLLPVITLTMYFGAEQWTAPTDLYGMLSADTDILRFVDNYHLHLIAPAQIPDEDFRKFHTELNQALKYVKYSSNKNRLNDLLHEDEMYRHISRKTANMLNLVTGSDLHYEKGKETVDMCLAIEEMRNAAKAEGMETGIEKGIAQGMEKGMAQGMEKGRAQGMEKGILGAIAICRDLGLDNNDIIARIIANFSVTRTDAERYLNAALSET